MGSLKRVRPRCEQKWRKHFTGVSISGEGAWGDDIVSEIANGTALKSTLGTGFLSDWHSVQPAGRVCRVEFRRDEPQEMPEKTQLTSAR